MAVLFLIISLSWSPVTAAEKEKKAVAKEKTSKEAVHTTPEDPQQWSLTTQKIDYVESEAGNCPFILVGGHTGESGAGVFEPRNCDDPPDGCRGGKDCQLVGDTRTWDLAHALAAEITDRMRCTPPTVINKIRRLYCDFNRDAYDPDGGLACVGTDSCLSPWRSFHQKIADRIAECKERFGECCVVIDIHGTGRDELSQVIALGIGNDIGDTTPFLRGRDPDLALFFGEGGLRENLATGNIKFHPQTAEGNCDLLCGGFIVRKYSGRYGSDETAPAGKVDSVQLEFGSELRESDAISTTASSFATAFTDSWKAHQPARCQVIALDKNPPLFRPAFEGLPVQKTQPVLKWFRKTGGRLSP